MKKSKKKIIWIDLDNSPHVPFFKPIIPELEKRGFTLFITARDAYQVTDLASLFQIPYVKIGKHYGKNQLMKIVGTIVRAFQLALIIVFRRPSLAVSHGSRSQAVAAKMLGLKSLCIYDYEHAASYSFTQATWGLVPEVVFKEILSPKTMRRIYSYPGIKEDAYVPFFRPDIDIRKELGIPDSKIVALVRPPATEAHYHNHEADIILARVLSFIDAHDAISVVVPRNQRQYEAIACDFGNIITKGNLLLPKKVYDGLLMIWYSDLVVSGGGTMNREATALGVPVYSIFKGKIGAVDRYLSLTGKLVMIENPDDVERKIKLNLRDKARLFKATDNKTLNSIVTTIDRLSQIAQHS